MGSMKNKIVASCLQEERDKCDFDATLGGGIFSLLDKEFHERALDAMKFCRDDPILRNHHEYYDMTREEKWKLGMKKLNRAY